MKNTAIPPPSPLSVLIADDHTLILEIIAILLENSPEITLSTAISVEGAKEQLARHGTFDLILLDLDMPGMLGAETMKQIAALNAGKPVGIITGGPTPQIIEEMSRNGAAGVVPKTTSMKSLTNAIRFMAGGERYFPRDLIGAGTNVQNTFVSPLSASEADVLDLLSEGLSDHEIGERLGFAEPAVQIHVKSLCRKLGAPNRVEAVVTARNLNLA